MEEEFGELVRWTATTVLSEASELVSREKQWLLHLFVTVQQTLDLPKTTATRSCLQACQQLLLRLMEERRAALSEEPEEGEKFSCLPISLQLVSMEQLKRCPVFVSSSLEQVFLSENEEEQVAADGDEDGADDSLLLSSSSADTSFSSSSSPPPPPQQEQEASHFSSCRQEFPPLTSSSLFSFLDSNNVASSSSTSMQPPPPLSPLSPISLPSALPSPFNPLVLLPSPSFPASAASASFSPSSVSPSTTAPLHSPFPPLHCSASNSAASSPLRKAIFDTPTNKSKRRRTSLKRRRRRTEQSSSNETSTLSSCSSLPHPRRLIPLKHLLVLATLSSSSSPSSSASQLILRDATGSLSCECLRPNPCFLDQLLLLTSWTYVPASTSSTSTSSHRQNERNDNGAGKGKLIEKEKGKEKEKETEKGEEQVREEKLKDEGYLEVARCVPLWPLPKRVSLLDEGQKYKTIHNKKRKRNKKKVPFWSTVSQVLQQQSEEQHGTKQTYNNTTKKESKRVHVMGKISAISPVISHHPTHNDTNDRRNNNSSSFLVELSDMEEGQENKRLLLVFTDRHGLRWHPFLRPNEVMLFTHLREQTMTFAAPCYSAMRENVRLQQAQQKRRKQACWVISKATRIVFLSSSSKTKDKGKEKEEEEEEADIEKRVEPFVGRITAYLRHGVFEVELAQTTDDSTSVPPTTPKTARLFLTHHHCRNFGRGLRVGTTIALHNAHLLFLPRFTPFEERDAEQEEIQVLFEGFGLCNYGHLEVVSFSPWNEPFLPLLLQRSPFYPYFLQSNLVTTSWLIRIYEQLQQKVGHNNKLILGRNGKHTEGILWWLLHSSLLPFTPYQRNIWSEFTHHHQCCQIARPIPIAATQLPTIAQLQRYIETKLCPSSCSSSSFSSSYSSSSCACSSSSSSYSSSSSSSSSHHNYSLEALRINQRAVSSTELGMKWIIVGHLQGDLSAGLELKDNTGTIAVDAKGVDLCHLSAGTMLFIRDFTIVIQHSSLHPTPNKDHCPTPVIVRYFLQFKMQSDGVFCLAAPSEGNRSSKQEDTTSTSLLQSTFQKAITRNRAKTGIVTFLETKKSKKMMPSVSSFSSAFASWNLQSYIPEHLRPKETIFLLIVQKAIGPRSLSIIPPTSSPAQQPTERSSKQPTYCRFTIRALSLVRDAEKETLSLSFNELRGNVVVEFEVFNNAALLRNYSAMQPGKCYAITDVSLVYDSTWFGSTNREQKYSVGEATRILPIVFRSPDGTSFPEHKLSSNEPKQRLNVSLSLIKEYSRLRAQVKSAKLEQLNSFKQEIQSGRDALVSIRVQVQRISFKQNSSFFQWHASMSQKPHQHRHPILSTRGPNPFHSCSFLLECLLLSKKNEQGFFTPENDVVMVKLSSLLHDFPVGIIEGAQVQFDDLLFLGDNHFKKHSIQFKVVPSTCILVKQQQQQHHVKGSSRLASSSDKERETKSRSTISLFRKFTEEERTRMDKAQSCFLSTFNTDTPSAPTLYKALCSVVGFRNVKAIWRCKSCRHEVNREGLCGGALCENRVTFAPSSRGENEMMLPSDDRFEFTLEVVCTIDDGSAQAYLYLYDHAAWSLLDFSADFLAELREESSKVGSIKIFFQNQNGCTIWLPEQQINYRKLLDGEEHVGISGEWITRLISYVQRETFQRGLTVYFEPIQRRQHNNRRELEAKEKTIQIMTSSSSSSSTTTLVSPKILLRAFHVRPVNVLPEIHQLLSHLSSST
ncbi:hypothetical protein QOT17_005765 [Balamuthia mandrillaris]